MGCRTSPLGATAHAARERRAATPIVRGGECMVRLLRQRLLLKLLSLIKLRKQCRLLVPFLFGEANPHPNLKPTWLAIMAGRARPDEPEVSRWRAGGGMCW